MFVCFGGCSHAAAAGLRQTADLSLCPALFSSRFFLGCFTGQLEEVAADGFGIKINLISGLESSFLFTLAMVVALMRGYSRVLSRGSHRHSTVPAPGGFVCPTSGSSQS